MLGSVLMKPLPYSHAEELVAIGLTAPGINIKNLNPSKSTYFIFREQSRTFQNVGLYTGYSVNITGSAEPEHVPGRAVSDGVLSILGLTPLLGRPFTREDNSPSGGNTIMLTYGFGRRKFGGDRSVIGRTMTVVGNYRKSSRCCRKNSTS